MRKLSRMLAIISLYVLFYLEFIDVSVTLARIFVVFYIVTLCLLVCYVCLKYSFPLFPWYACKLAKLSACIAKEYMTTINQIYIYILTKVRFEIHVLRHDKFTVHGSTQILSLVRNSPQLNYCGTLTSRIFKNRLI